MFSEFPFDVTKEFKIGDVVVASLELSITISTSAPLGDEWTNAFGEALNKLLDGAFGRKLVRT